MYYMAITTDERTKEELIEENKRLHEKNKELKKKIRRLMYELEKLDKLKYEKTDVLVDEGEISGKYVPSSNGKRKVYVRVKEGEVYNKLTVMGFDSVKNGHRYWWCRCECGGVKIVREDNIVNGKVKSCGCLPVGRSKSVKNSTEERNTTEWILDKFK